FRAVAGELEIRKARPFRRHHDLEASVLGRRKARRQTGHDQTRPQHPQFSTVQHPLPPSVFFAFTTLQTSALSGRRRRASAAANAGRSTPPTSRKPSTTVCVGPPML